MMTKHHCHDYNDDDDGGYDDDDDDVDDDGVDDYDDVDDDLGNSGAVQGEAALHQLWSVNAANNYS